MSARTEFDRELEVLHLNIIRMGGLIEDAIDKSIYALEKRDKELANIIIQNDKQIDDLERLIETESLRLLLKQQPVARDLRAISTALKMITDMERIGDHASDIADLTLRFGDEPFVKSMEHIPLMANIASSMVKDAINAYVRTDIEAAQTIIKRDDEVDNLFETIKQDLVTVMKTTNDQEDQVIDFLMVAKYLERIGDHAVNIAEWVIFYVTGQHKDTRIL